MYISIDYDWVSDKVFFYVFRVFEYDKELLIIVF